MEKILDTIEASALKVMTVDAADLQGLAQLHTHLQTLTDLAQAQVSAGQTGFEQTQAASRAAADLIEKIILDEIDNAQAGITAVRETVQTLQKMIQQCVEGQTTTAYKFPSLLGLSENHAAKDAASVSEGTSLVEEPGAVTSGSTDGPAITLPANVDEAIFREFLANLPDVLSQLEAAVLAAEENSSDDNRNAIKGILHNLKGESSLLGLDAMSTLCHETESRLVEAGAKPPIEALFSAKDQLQRMLDQFNGVSTTTVAQKSVVNQENTVKDNPAENVSQPEAISNAGPASLTIAESDAILAGEFVQESREHLETAEAGLLKIEENPHDIETINAIFRAFHTIKGVAGFLNLKPIGNLAHAAENLLDLGRKEKLTLEGDCMDVVFGALDMMKTMINTLATALKTVERAWTPPGGIDQLISRLKVQSESGTTSATSTPATPVVSSESGVSQEVLTSSSVSVEHDAESKGIARQVISDATVKVTTTRLDALINMVGELVIAQSMVHQDLAGVMNEQPRLERNVRHLDKITRNLQELSMSMRMVQVQGVFQKMARLVRDLSRKAGKNIEFVTIGGDTEVDRNVAEAVSDPLVHMVRNSVDHGIETPEERAKTGKPEMAKVELRAFHQGGNVVITIRDDGRGLDRDRLIKKAQDMGIIQPGQDILDQDAYRLIFHPGLSTAKKVTDISGRGVGMDVVRKNIEMLRGRIDIESRPGKGATFIIRLPLTLAVIDGQIMSVGQEQFIVPIISIEQSLRPQPEQLSTVQGQGEMMMIRGQLLPLVRLHRLFGIADACSKPEEGLVMVVGDGDERYCLLVDNLLGQQQVVIKSLGGYFGSIPGVSGGAIMGDGRVRLILDIPGLRLGRLGMTANSV
ncbi:MAG: chemotaxis protein CheA [Sedimentisphaerales bacterium]|nr:chemotaxis protein CheA [Sedimentisphaerales bacterium]